MPARQTLCDSILPASRTCWLGLVVAMLTLPAGLSSAQQLLKPIQTWQAPETPVANHPVSIDPKSTQPRLDRQTYPSNRVPNQIGNQIGFVTFDEPAEQGRGLGRTDTNPATAAQAPAAPAGIKDPTSDIAELFNSQAGNAISPAGIWPSIKVALLLAVLSLAPAIVLMTTCYVRVVVVLTLLRQAFGGQQLPPMQVVTALSLFLTLLIMAPVWNQVKTDAIDPYTRDANPIGWEEAWQRGIEPVKHFMVSQIKASGNSDSVAVFYKHLPDAGPLPSTIEQVPINVLLPAFLISELKIAFLLGFQIFLPFLILDLVVSSVTVSSGMLMLPPTMVSFPLKLILFVMVDGWNLVVGMLLQSFAPI
jgi:flagellar biosynthetic protein FliP